MGRQIEALARFAAHTRWDDIPAPVQRQTKLVLLDTAGVILAGSVRPEVEQAVDCCEEWQNVAEFPALLRRL